MTQRAPAWLRLGPRHDVYRRADMNAAPGTLTAPAGRSRRPRAARGLPDASRGAFVAWSGLFVVLYVALDAASMVFPFGPIPVTPWNPQAGLAIAAASVGGRRSVAAVVVAAVVAEFVVRGATGVAFDLAGGLVLGLAYAATGIAFRARNADRSIVRMEALRDFLLIALVGTGVAAAAYALCYAAVGNGGSVLPLGDVLRKWLGDYVGAVAVAPALLALIDGRVRRPAVASLVLDALLFGVGLFAVLALVFGLEPIGEHRLFYLLFVPLIFLATRHEFGGAAFAVACVQIALVAAMLVNDTSSDDATEYELLMVVLATTTLLLGSATTERRRALSELARRSAELREQQAALSDAMRVAAASEAASTLAHEMSQPLSAIGTYARAGIEMLRRGTAQPGDIAGILERIEQETVRSSEVVRRVRDFFRTGSARREPTDVAELVHDAIDAVRDRLSRERVFLALDVPPDLPRADVDRVQLGTVMHNLLINAIDALADSPAPRRIRVGARRGAAEEIEIDVEDSGPGVDDDVAASLFEPLATTKPAGMGLGLAICRTIVQAHGGRMWLVSSKPTLFRFTLPIHGQQRS
jgi:two-component system sensor kinase FixL